MTSELAVFKVLVIEDDRGDARLLDIMLKEALGLADVQVVPTLKQALGVIETQAFDIVFCDLNLPDSFGPDTVEALTVYAPGVALVVVTGLSDRETALAALGGGAQSFLVKGEITPALLKHAVLEARRLKRSELEEARARFIVENSLDGFWVCDLDGLILDVNDAVCHLVGHSRESLVGTRIASIDDVADGGSALAAHLDEILDTGGARFESAYRHLDGAVVEVEVSAHYRAEEGGQILAFVRDVTERNRLVRSLAESERRFRDVSEAAGEFLWECDIDGRFTYVSDRVGQVLGHAPDDVVGRPPFDFMPAEEAERVRSWFVQMAAEGKPFRDLEHRATHKRGHEIWQRVSGLPVFGPNGAVVGYRGTSLDITLRRRDQMALRDREQRLAAILGAVADAVIAIDDTGIIQSFNPAAERIFGWSPKEAIGRDVIMLMPEPYASAHAGYILNYLRSGVPQIIGKGRELIGLRRDGSTFPMDLTVTEATLDEPRLFIGIVRDITERKAMEDNLRRLATTDPLTGAANRRHFMDMLAEELARAKRYGHPLTVAMVDIDHFKRLNDTYGHAAGDMALIAFVAEIQERLRETDMLGRLGGEEFALLLPETTAEGGRIAVDALRAHRESVVLEHEGRSIRFTMSAGVADTNHACTGQGLLAAADAALYRSKHEGRNRVTVAEPPEEQG